MNDAAFKHWQDGNKYAAEGMRLCFYANASAVTALLAFVEKRNDPVYLPLALIMFAAGAVFSIFLHFCAYFTQLGYGNRESGKKSPNPILWHIISYVSFVLSLLLFIGGIVFSSVYFGLGSEIWVVLRNLF